MSQLDIRNELQNAAVEPLLPIEKKLIGWSLGTGLVLLVVLAIVNHYVPASFLSRFSEPNQRIGVGEVRFRTMTAVSHGAATRLTQT